MPFGRTDMMLGLVTCCRLSDLASTSWAMFCDIFMDGTCCLLFLHAPVDRIAIENPIGVLSTVIRKPNQIIQPWQFGHGETKATCLWLKGLPPLKPTNIVKGREARVHREPPGPDRWKNRSRTLQGIADAMAIQWGEQQQEAAA